MIDSSEQGECREVYNKRDGVSPNETSTESKMRSDLERIADMIGERELLIDAQWYTPNYGDALHNEIAILRELLTSWQAVTQAEYQTGARFHLNMLTKKMLMMKNESVPRP